MSIHQFSVWECVLHDRIVVNGTVVARRAPKDFASADMIPYARAIHGFVHPDDQTHFTAAIQACVDGATSHFYVEYRHPTGSDGATSWRLARGTSTRAPDGTPTGFIGMSADITALKQAEERSRGAQDLVELAMQVSGSSLWEYHLRDGGILQSQSALKKQRTWVEGADTGATEDFHSNLRRKGIPPDDVERIVAAIQACVDGASPTFHVEFRSQGAEGARWQLARGVARPARQGMPAGFVGVTTDTTELKLAEENTRQVKERLELAVRGSQMSVWDFDLTVGDAVPRELEGYNVWESRGHPSRIPASDYASSLKLVVAVEDQAHVTAAISACIRGETPAFQAEYRALGYDDALDHWRLARGKVIRGPDGSPARFVGTSLDITDLKQTEAALERARGAAEAANRAKDDFLANVSHEIRTPMNAILGMTALALESVQTDHVRQLVSTVKSAAQNLLGLINDLLDFSKMTAGKLALDEADFSLRLQLGDGLRALVTRAQRKGLKLTCNVEHGVPDALFGDAGRLQQAMTNLIDNAIKFTASGAVVVNVSAAPRSVPSGDRVLLTCTVRDTGIGIAPDKRQAIFRAFEQEDASTTRRYGGTGLGLTISAQIAALMDGGIAVESEQGQGSTFILTASFARSSKPDAVRNDEVPQPPEATRGALAGATSLRVLVAEDNDLNVAFLAELLKQRGHRAEFAGDGRAALSLVSSARYDLLLLDLHMPEMDGFEVVRVIRDQERATGRHLPIIALTARSSAQDRERCLAAGMDDFLPKPIEIQALWAAVARALEAFPPARRRHLRLLDLGVIRRVCGGRAEVLGKLCEIFRESVAEQLTRARLALRDGDLLTLGEVAHLLQGTLSAFSPVAGEIASELEGAAHGDEARACTELVLRLELSCSEVLEETRGLTVDDLDRSQSES